MRINSSSASFYARLLAYLKPTRLARPLFSPSDVRREDRRRNRVQPDVFVVRYRDGKLPDFPIELDELLLVVEVLSPSTATYDPSQEAEALPGRRRA